ncbi:MAG TPA: MFS transporter [Acidimicrobiales bacterium]|nr:MFS transporter [Acidimicrobiales bacterium]
MARTQGSGNGGRKRLATTEAYVPATDPSPESPPVDGELVMDLAPLRLEPQGDGGSAPAVVDGDPIPRQRRQRGWVFTFADNLRPSVATGGTPGTPLLVLAGITFLDQFDKQAFAALAPEVKDFFGLDLTGITVLVGLATLATILLTVPVGYLADRRRRTWLAGLGSLCLGVFALASGIVPAVVLFAIARAGAGLNRTTDAVHQSLLSDWYPPAVRPGVFTFRQMAYEAGSAVGPLVAGAIAAITLWQVTFIILAVPALLLTWVCFFVLREPVRGEQERRAMGATEEEALEEERPPSFGESVRVAWSVRTLRRIIWSLPFLVGGLLGLATLTSLYYDQVFNVGPGLRGVFLAVQQPFALLGLLVGGVLGNAFLKERPARVIAYAGGMGVASALAILGIAAAPNLLVAVGLSCLLNFMATILAPASQALLSLVVPARARALALSLGALAILPGYLFFFFAGYMGDHHGIRVGIGSLAPVFAIGSIIIASAASSVAGDIRAAAAAAMAAKVSRDAKAAGQAKLLVARDLDVAYGPVQVLFNVDFEVDEGEIIALLGTNGAGKSTLLRAISGLTEAANGAIFCDGEDITHLPAHEHAARGIVMMPGGKGVFPTLTVAENLRLAGWVHPDEATVRTRSVLDLFPELVDHLDNAAGNLSGGEQQMVALAQAFLSRPRLLMIDELSLGLSPVLVTRLIEAVRAIHQQGTTVILVEQSVNVALTVADRAVFMEKGEVRFSGPTAELMARSDILRSVYLRGSGRVRMSSSAPLTAPEEEGPALEVRGMTKRFGGVNAVNDVSFTLDHGQILGIIGPNGAGKTTLFDLISGFITPDSGSVVMQGQDLTSFGPDQRSALGLLRSFQDARLFPALTVSENLAVALDRQLPTKSATLAALRIPTVTRGEARLERRIERLVEMFGLQALRNKFVRELSTGQRRLVDMACVLATEPKVLLLDEPSSGIAQREAEELGPLLRRIQQDTGCSMLVIEHDMPLLVSVAPELIALDQGTFVVRGPADEVLEHPQVVASYLGTSEEVINRSVRQ